MYLEHTIEFDLFNCTAAQKQQFSFQIPKMLMQNAVCSLTNCAVRLEWCTYKMSRFVCIELSKSVCP